jgi:large subunit ribosomal protein L1
MKLNIDSKEISQPLRGTVVLPHGTGRKVRIVVFCKGEDVKTAQDENADFVGGADLIEKINSGWLDFDVTITTPEMMKEVSRLGKILGPRGLMPSPKAGTVTPNIREAIREFRSGKIEFKMDKGANIHVPIGKISFTPEMLYENALSLIKAIIHAKHPSSKGQFLRSLFISTTMGPGIKVDTNEFK